jgi:hypothetical protein
LTEAPDPNPRAGLFAKSCHRFAGIACLFCQRYITSRRWRTPIKAKNRNAQGREQPLQMNQQRVAPRPIIGRMQRYQTERPVPIASHTTIMPNVAVDEARATCRRLSRSTRSGGGANTCFGWGTSVLKVG